MIADVTMRLFMKKIKLLIIIIALAVTGIACKKEKPVTDSEKFLIVASFYPVYIIAKNVADGIKGVRVVNMTPPVTGCLHDYSITASDMKNLENAGILLINGAGMESFLDKTAKKFPGLKTAGLSGGIKLIKDKDGENPHIWVSITNVVAMTENCAGILSEADPGNSALYKKNSGMYISKLNELRKEMSSGLEKFHGRKIVTFHEAFPYFAAEYGLEISAVIEREPGSEPSAGELADIIKTVRIAGIKIIFAEPQYPSSSAEVIARETGAKIFVLDPAVTGDDDKDAYLKIIKKNLAVMKDAFSR